MKERKKVDKGEEKSVKEMTKAERKEKDKSWPKDIKRSLMRGRGRSKNEKRRSTSRRLIPTENY